MAEIFYLAKVDMAYTSGNKLEAAVKDFIYCSNRQIIPSKEVEKFKSSITAHLGKLVKLHPKCKTIEFHWWTPNDGMSKSKDWGLSFGGRTIIVFWLYAGRLS